MSNRTDPYLISIIGPTAVGKTDLAVEIAELLSTEIVSSDSRQFYREMNIGTAKPTVSEQERIPHHFVDSHGIEEDYNVGEFERDMIELLTELFNSYQHVVMVGGSGLYCKAVWEGLDHFPGIDPYIRKQLQEEVLEHGLSKLRLELAQTDPDYFEEVDVHNPQRILRALEVIRSTGEPFSSFRNREEEKKPVREFRSIKIGLEMDREELYDRIDRRMDQMILDGLFEEARELYPYRNLNALRTVGYSEIFKYLDGEYDYQEAVRLLKRNSRRYAKRQFTWFKRDPDIQWFLPTQREEIMRHLHGRLGLNA
ncbi:MAG: tRNA (adenosine(37)-N6)-dimethylallyltransferase MiaA [Bacteroidota bacterium]